MAEERASTERTNSVSVKSEALTGESADSKIASLHRFDGLAGSLRFLSQVLFALGIRSEARRRSVLSATGSVLLHLIVLVVVLLLVLLWSDPQSRGVHAFPIEASLVDTELADLGGGWDVEGATALSLDVIEEASKEASPSPTEVVAKILADGPSAAEATPSDVAGGLGSGEGLGGALGGLGEGRSQGSGAADFFGAPVGNGDVVFVIDRSMSMAGARIEMAKRELLRSVASLRLGQRFQVVFYGSMAEALSVGNGGMVVASSKNRDEAGRQIRAFGPRGGTEHFTALQKALAFGSEVIVLLTDAEYMNPALVRSITDLNRSRGAGKRATIHVIQISERKESDRDRESMSMRSLAKQNGGTFRLIASP